MNTLTKLKLHLADPQHRFSRDVFMVLMGMLLSVVISWFV